MTESLPLASVPRPVVLFLCTGNSARSQMAEAFLRAFAGDRFEVHSAGLRAAGIHPLTTRVMGEVGIDMGEHHSKEAGALLGRLAVHVAIVVCQSEELNCPKLWPWAPRLLEWPFDDPAAVTGDEEAALAAFRGVRDRIRERVLGWLAENDLAP